MYLQKNTLFMFFCIQQMFISQCTRFQTVSQKSFAQPHAALMSYFMPAAELILMKYTQCNKTEAFLNYLFVLEVTSDICIP